MALARTPGTALLAALLAAAGCRSIHPEPHALPAAPAHDHAERASIRCVPVGERAGREFGCYITATQRVGRLPPTPVFWNLHRFPTRTAAEAAAGRAGTAVESFGEVWLFTLAEAGWRPPGGEHVAEVGPLPVTAGGEYTAQYMESVMRPGTKSAVHRHAGPEAFYTLSGETCLETPEGAVVGRARGGPVVVPGGVPMELTATGAEVRRGLVLVLHDATQPASSPAPDWTPRGLCGG